MVDERVILHADMDAFYAAVEQRDRPELRGKPVVVGGSSGRGVVMTASYEARPFGIHSAMPSMHAKRLCPDAIFVAGRPKVYRAVSKQILRVFEEFTPDVEPLSLDEAFLDVTGSLRLFGAPRVIGERLRERVFEETQLTVSVGIGPTKMVAKIASDSCKPDGLWEVAPADVGDFLRPLPVKRLWGVGPKMQERLRRLGLETIGDIADADPALLAGHLGDHGEALQRMSRGQDRRSVQAGRARKSIGEERTLQEDRSDGEELRALVRAQAEAVARRLRRAEMQASSVTLKFKLTNRVGPGKYPLVTRAATLRHPVDDGPTVAKAALRLWDKAHEGRPVRLIGVSVSHLVPAAQSQLDLFGAASAGPSRLNKAIDELADRFGRDAVRRGDLRKR